MQSSMPLYLAPLFAGALGLFSPAPPATAQTTEAMTVEIGHVSQSSIVEITVTLTSNDTRSHAWVHVGCTLLDEKGAPVETSSTSITNVRPGSRNYGTVSLYGKSPWKTQTCRVEEASRSEAR